MFCNKCGNEIKKGEKICSKCGNKVKKSKIKDLSIGKKILLTMVAIIMIMFIIAITIYEYNSNDKVLENAKQINENQIESNINKENNQTNTNMNEEITVMSDENIRERFENSYNQLIDEINSFNNSMAINNQNNKILQTPVVGKLYALYSKEKDELVYMQYYGKQAGTEIIWIDAEVEAPSAKFEGHYGETIMKPYILKAININGQVLDQRNSSVDFSVFSAIIGLIEKPETDSAKTIANSYILKEFEWSVNTNYEISLNEIEIGE